MAINFNKHQSFANYFSKDKLRPWLYYLSLDMAKGNVCLDVEQKIQDTVGENISIDDLKNELVGKPGAVLPFILNNGKLYMHRFFHYEQSLVMQIQALCTAEKDKSSNLLALKEFINHQLFPESERSDDMDWQKIACLNAFLNNFNIISGGPGTGKTTTVSKLLLLLLKENPNLKIKICAPTGKAAARLQESLSKTKSNFKYIEIETAILDKVNGLTAETIHRTLGYISNSIYFKHNAERTLDADVLVVDECSMIDISLFHKLFQAIDTQRTKVILLGDKNQLASVDAGSVFRDLCTGTVPLNIFSKERTQLLNLFVAPEKQKLEAMHDAENSEHPLFGHIIELKKSYRFNDEKGIGKLSRAVLNNDWKAIEPFFKNEDEQITFFENREDFERLIEKAIAALKVEHGGFIGTSSVETVMQKMNNSTVLCANREGKHGVAGVNEKIQQVLFKNQNLDNPFQLIMVSQNQPVEEVYNGDIGVVLENKEGRRFVFFPNGALGQKKLSQAQIRSYEPAFAMTIHKSQGSEFNEVFIVLPDQKENFLLNRELLYTAITRAKQKVYILAQREIIQTIVQHSVQRVSGITDHFLNLKS